jgi:hypothetical protein
MRCLQEVLWVGFWPALGYPELVEELQRAQP